VKLSSVVVFSALYTAIDIYLTGFIRQVPDR